MYRRKIGITFNQFFNFFDKTYILWVPLYDFRLIMIKTFFPDNRSMIILNRKLRITEIKKYKLNHNGKYPNYDYNCVKQVIDFILRNPNPNSFDYDYDYCPLYNFHDYAKNLIRIYDPQFNNYNINFRKRHLINKTCFNVLNEMDRMYHRFATCGQGSMSQTSSYASSSIRSSGRLDEVIVGVDNKNKIDNSVNNSCNSQQRKSILKVTEKSKLNSPKNKLILTNSIIA